MYFIGGCTFQSYFLVPESLGLFHLDGVFFLSESGTDVFNLVLLISVLEILIYLSGGNNKMRYFWPRT